MFVSLLSTFMLCIDSLVAGMFCFRAKDALRAEGVVTSDAVHESMVYFMHANDNYKIK